VSTLGTVSLDDVAARTDSPLWFQLYAWGDRGLARDLVQRAQQLGYSALLLTADVSVRSKRERELRQGVKLPTPELTLRTLLDGALHPSWSWHFATSDPPGFPNVGQQSATSPDEGELAAMFDGTISWDDVEWIRLLYGLAAAGEAGVRHAVDILVEELRTAMALCGAASLQDLDPGMVRRRPTEIPATFDR
jgi:L-lactate dehydrogenase (cytochrome)